MEPQRSPILVVNPSQDREFHARAEAEVAAGAVSPGELQAALRVTYPNAVVRSRDLSGEKRVVWYVYREGRWVGRHDPDRG